MYKQDQTKVCRSERWGGAEVWDGVGINYIFTLDLNQWTYRPSTPPPLLTREATQCIVLAHSAFSWLLALDNCAGIIPYM
jgi:hypothetical protein